MVVTKRKTKKKKKQMEHGFKKSSFKFEYGKDYNQKIKNNKVKNIACWLIALDSAGHRAESNSVSPASTHRAASIFSLFTAMRYLQCVIYVVSISTKAERKIDLTSPYIVFL